MAASFSLFVKIAAVDKITSTLAKITGTTSKFGTQMRALGRSMSVGVSLPLAAIAALSTRTALTFEDSFSQVRAITGKTDRELKDVKDSVIAIGKAADLGPTKVAEAFKRLVAGGFGLDEAQAALPHVAQLAKATGVEAAVAAGMIDDLGDSFHLGTGSALMLADAIARMRIVGETDAGVMVDDLKAIAPAATAARMSLTGSLIPALALLRAENVENAAAGLRSVIVALSQRGFTDAAGNLLPLVDIIGDLEKRGFTGTQIMAEFGARAGPTLAKLVELGSSALRGSSLELLKHGSAAEQAARAQDGLKGSLDKLSAQWESFQVKVAQSRIVPFLEKVVGVLDRVLDRFLKLPTPIQDIFLLVAGAAIVFAPLILALTAVVGLLGALGIPVGTALAIAGGGVLAGGAALALAGSNSPKAAETMAPMANVGNPDRLQLSRSEVKIEVRGLPGQSRVTTNSDGRTALEVNLGRRLQFGQ